MEHSFNVASPKDRCFNGIAVCIRSLPLPPVHFYPKSVAPKPKETVFLSPLSAFETSNQMSGEARSEARPSRCSGAGHRHARREEERVGV